VRQSCTFCHVRNFACYLTPRQVRTILRSYKINRGSDSSVGIATGYELDGPVIESRWGARLSAPVQTGPEAPPSLLYNGYRVFPGGKERPGHDADPSPPSSAVVKERVELYLYSPYGPYGLYRSSVPVQGCTLPTFTKPKCRELTTNQRCVTSQKSEHP